MNHNSKADFSKLFTNSKDKTVLVVGDLMLDHYMWGTVDRISPEAPVPVVSVFKKDERLGGAGNVLMNLKGLKCNPIICSVLGEDSTGDRILNILKSEKLKSDFIIVSNKRKSSIKTRIIGNNQQMIRVDEEMTDEISKEEAAVLLNYVEIALKSEAVDALIIQDYNKGVISSDIIEKIIQLGNNLQVPVLADPKIANFSAYKNLYLLKPNLKELNEGVRQQLNKNDIVLIAKEVQKLRRQMDIQKIMVTLSENGMIVCSDLGTEHIPSYVRKVADVSGAGDTVISLAALCYALQIEDYATGVLCNLAAGLVCEEVGVVPVELNQLKLAADKWAGSNL